MSRVAGGMSLNLDWCKGLLPAFRLHTMLDGPRLGWHFDDAVVWLRPDQLHQLADLVHAAIVGAALHDTDTGESAAPQQLDLPFPTTQESK